MERVLRNRSDIRSVFMVLLTLAGLAVPFVYEVSWVWFFVQTYLAFSCCVINHNHTHFPVFYSEKFNSIFGVLLTLARGHTSQGVVVPHNLNHHVHAGTTSDWSDPAHAGRGWGVIRILRYLFISSIVMAKERFKPHAPRLAPRMRKQLRKEKIALFSLIGTGLIISPKLTFVYWLLPWLIAMESMLTVNLIQHDGTFCRDFTGPILNSFFFNNGFHSAHHEKPSLHWSELPRYHFETAYPKGDQRRSFVYYVFRQYVWIF